MLWGSSSTRSNRAPSALTACLSEGRWQRGRKSAWQGSTWQAGHGIYHVGSFVGCLAASMCILGDGQRLWMRCYCMQGLVWVRNGRRCAKHCWVVAVPSSRFMGPKDPRRCYRRRAFRLLKRIMQFLEVPDRSKQSPQRPLPSRPYTSKSVMYLLFKLRVIVRKLNY